MADDLRIQTDDGVLRLTFDAPETLNALTPAMVEGASHELEEAMARDDVRVVVLDGAGSAFSAGAALLGDDPVTDFDITALDRANRLIRAVTRLDKPVLAAVRGVAAGVGCSVALASDLQLAAESASFLLAFGRIGLTCDGGASATVAAAAGRAAAMRMALLAEPMSGRAAYDAGLVSHCAPDAEFDEALATLVARLAAGPPLSFAATKRMVNAASLPGLEPALEAERLAQSALLGTADVGEGMRAFVEKRPPMFRGV